MNPQHRFNIGYALMALSVVLLIQWYLSQNVRVESVAYSAFEHALQEGQIAKVLINGESVIGEIKQPVAGGPTRLVTTLVDPALAARLSAYDAEFSAVPQNTLLRTLFSWIAPALVFIGLWLLVFRRIAGKQGMGGGLMAIGKSKARVYVETGIKVTFADVAGVDEAKNELQEVVNALKNPDRYARLGARLPKGILLVGPPGTGKTLLARAVAGEANVPFFSISGSEFVEMFVGVGAARVRDLFAQAQQRAPAIIFIDELDALGRARNSYGPHGGNDEKEQTLNQLLAELDGFDPRSGVVLLAATNRPEVLDPALLRAGRFDRQVLVDRPDKAGRIQILEVHLHKVKLAPGLDPEPIAALTPGFSGADLANLVNEAAMLATRRDGDTVTLDDFTQAVERIVAGLEKRNRLLNPQERRVVACHELGHALVAMSLSGTDPVHKVSIIPRGVGALGYTIQRPTEDRYLMSRTELSHKMAVLLGGRAAESLLFEDVSTGAADDLVKATDIARGMALRYGMVEEIGQVAWDESRGNFLGDGGISIRQYSDATAEKIDEAVRQLVDQAFHAAVDVIRDHRPALERAAEVLLQKETLQTDELRALLLDGADPRPSPPAPTAAGGSVTPELRP